MSAPAFIVAVAEAMFVQLPVAVIGGGLWIIEHRRRARLQRSIDHLRGELFEARRKLAAGGKARADRRRAQQRELTLQTTGALRRATPEPSA